VKLFNDLTLKFEKPQWKRNTEFALMDTILEQHPELIALLAEDITRGSSTSQFGRQDTPSVEQIVRAAIFKEMKGLDYRQLEYAQMDSRICASFIKLDQREPFSFQMFQKYISKIQTESLEQVLFEINKLAVSEGLEDIQSIRQDSTVVKSNIHYPTNNALVWDCIRESHRLLAQLHAECKEVSFRDYRKGAKRSYFKINVTKSKEVRANLFLKQLETFTKCINQVSNAVKKKVKGERGKVLMAALDELLPLMRQVFSMTWRKEILGEKVANSEKIFSIYEAHTDIIVKGGREAEFGHKVNLVTGRSNLILDCQVLKGNPHDSSLYQPTMDRVINGYGKVPRDSSTDGGYASLANLDYGVDKGISNIVFNKVVGSMESRASSQNMETRLKKWRSGIEAVISNWKRGFEMRICEWKGWLHFRAKVFWSVIAYNFRVMTRLILEKIQKKKAFA